MAGELELQEKFSWSRENVYSGYNRILGHYQVVNCLELTENMRRNAAGKLSLIDMPCGDGVVLEMLAPYFGDVLGIDASSAHLQKAAERVPNAKFIHNLIEDVKLDRKYDVITMLNILEHVPEPQVTLAKAAELLCDDGVIIVHVPNAEAVNRKIAVLMGTLTHCEELSPFDINVAGHRRSYTMKTFVEELEKSGLEVRSTGGIFYKMLSTPQIDWFLANGLWNSGFGWGRVGEENKDWRSKFCEACYEFGKTRPEDCNVIYACLGKKR